MPRANDTGMKIVGGLALIAALTASHAQALPDPTKPPAGIDKLLAAPGDAATAEPAAAGLQAIIRRQGTRPAAVINGEYVVLGGRLGEAQVVAIGDDTVTLKSASGTETLKLAPDVDKVPSKPGAEEARRKPRQAAREVKK